MSYEHAWYDSPIDLPEGKSGKVNVRHRIVEPPGDVPVVGIRQALLRGIAPITAKLSKPLRIHELVQDGFGTWMTDNPEELNQIGEMMHDVCPKGRILVGGLGLGIVAHTLAMRPIVDKIVVVEKNKHVIKLCAREGYEVVCADVLEYLKKTLDRFDFYLLDTWQGTGEGVWWNQVMPLRRIIRQRWGAKPAVHCWAEDIMIGQLRRSLMEKPPHWYYDGLPMPMSPSKAHVFLSNVGLPVWEKRYGAIVDANLARMESER
jgi:hypothetical protein